MATATPAPPGMMEGMRPAPPEVGAVVGSLIARYFPELRSERFALLVRDTALEAEEGQVMVGACGVNTAPDAEFHCIFWFAWDVWQLMTPLEREAMVFHELMHCDHDEAGQVQLAPHDAAVFTQEVKRYGAWWERPGQAYRALRQSRNGDSKKGQ